MSAAFPIPSSTTSEALWAAAVGPDSEAARMAFGALAERYWYPIFAWWRRSGWPAESAARATETCFALWTSSEPPSSADSGIAHLREWILHRLSTLAAKDFTIRAFHALQVDPAVADLRYAREPERSADDLFQTRWAKSLLRRTLGALQLEYSTSGRDELFNGIIPFLGFTAAEEQVAAAIESTGLPLSAINLAIFELRKRYRELLCDQVSETVLSSAEMDSEITALLCSAS